MTDNFNDTEQSILRGIHQAINYAQGDENSAKVHVPSIDVHEVRTKLGLSQDRFADVFGVSAATIRNWEQGRREPQGAAKVLLNVIYHHPEAVINSLNYH